MGVVEDALDLLEGKQVHVRVQPQRGKSILNESGCTLTLEHGRWVARQGERLVERFRAERVLRIEIGHSRSSILLKEK